MTHPPPGLEFLDPQQAKTSSVPSGLEFLRQTPPQQTEEKQQGFVDYVSNVARNWIEGGGIKAVGNIVQALDPISASKMAQDPSVQQAGSDFMHMFSHIFDGMGATDPASIAMTIPRLLGMGRTKPKTTWSEDANNVAIGLFKPVSDLAELSSGLSLTGDDTRALTPEEKTARIKSSVGLAVAGAVAGPLSGALESQLVGGVGRRILANAITGVAAGSTYGMVAGANDKDQLAQIITNGIMGGTLGAAAGLLFRERGSNLKPQDIQQVRALQMDDNSLAGNINTAKALATGDDIASALLQGKIGLKEGDIHVVPGVNPGELASLNAKVPEGYRSAMHVDEDGVGRLLVRDETTNVDERFFEKTGLLRNQNVSYLGKEDWTVLDQGSDKNLIKLKNNIDGNIVEAHKNDIQLPSNVNIESIRQEQVDNLYSEWKKQLETPANQEAVDVNKQKYDLIGFDDEPPSDLLDKHPETEGISIGKSLDDYFATKKFNPDEIKSLKLELQLKLANEAFNKLSPEDQAIINKAKSEYQKDVRTSRQKVNEYKKMDRIARSNGYRISDGGSGRVIIRDGVSNRIVAGVDSYDQARDWINKSGKASGPKLDDNASGIDTGVASGGIPIPPGEPPKYPQDDPYNFFFSDKWMGKSQPGENYFKVLNNLSWATRYAESFKEYDRKYNTNTYRDIFERPNQLKNISNSQSRPYADRLFNIRKTTKATPSDAELIRQYAETMSPEEVISSFMSRPMNPTEINIAKNIASSGVDLERVFNYRRAIEKLDRDFPQEVRNANADKQMEYQQQIETAKQAYAMDDKHLQTVQILDGIEEQPKDKVSGGAVVRLARAINNGAGQTELSRAQFAAKHGMTLQQLVAANQSASLRKELANVFGISEDRQLGGYITHAKMFMDGDIPKAMKHFSGDLKTKDFYAKMSRTGEISAYETDSFKADLRYIKAGFDVKSGFTDAMTAARKAIEENLVKIPKGGQEQFRNISNNFLNDLQGIPEATNLASQEALDYIASQYKTGELLNKRSWTHAIVSLQNAGALGFRPMLGLGHLGISTIISTAARDAAYTSRVLINGGKLLADAGEMQKLQAKGVFRGMSPFSVMRDELQGKVGEAIDVAQNAAFKATLLPTIYDGMVAGHYTTTYADVMEGLTKFNRGEITGKQLTKDIFLRRYDAPVQNRFVSLAKTNVEDAAHYLGMQAVEDLVGTYGAGNTPYKWGTNIGRIAGQFGNYAMWIRATVQRMASRGTAADRITSIGKLVSAAYLAHKASQASGIDLTRLSPVHAMTWLFGPDVHIAEDAFDAVHTSGYQQAQALGRLKRILPVDGNGNIHPSIFIPGSYAVDGIVQAAKSFNEGNIVQGTLEGLGFRKYNAAKALGRGL